MPGRALSRLLLSALALPTLVLAGACEPAPAPPHNDGFAAATALASATHGQVAGSTIGATRQVGEPASFASSTVWFRWVAPSTGVATFTASSGVPVAIEPFTGTAVNRLRRIPVDEVLPQAGFRTVAGTAYVLRISSFAGATFGLKWQTTTAPANDHFSAASSINGASGSLIGDNTAATNDFSDPSIQGDRPPGTIWYRWTAPADGWYDFDTSGSHISTELGVYTSISPTRLVDDSSGDCDGYDFFGSSGASVGFHAASGTTYLLMLATSSSGDPGAADLGGGVQLNWHPAASAPVASGNDAFASPARLSGTNGSIDGTTVGATAEAGEPAHAPGVPARSSVWFSWTPPVTADYVLTSTAGDNDGCAAGITVYTGSTLAALRAVPVAYPDDSSGADFGITDGISIGNSDYSGLSADSEGFRVHLTAGTTYRLSADRIAQPGPFTLHWDIPQAAPVIRSATPGNGSIGVIWSPPPRTAGSQRTGYFVTVIPASDEGDFSSVPDEPITLPVTSAFTTIHGLTNGTAYRVIVAAVNGSGIGDVATSRPVTPAKLR